MIVKKQEKNNKIKAMYSSSTICASIFDTVTRDLIVIFNNGGQYKYPSVDLTDYTRFEVADSNGAVFNTYIKKKYANFEKMDPMDVSTILKEVEELKTADDKVVVTAKTKDMLEGMTLLIASYISTGNINKDLLVKIEGKIGDFQKAAYPDDFKKAVVA